MIHIAHHPIFVALSMVIACLGSWTALDLFRRVHAHVGTWRGAWLLASAVAMGLSIWAMHFIAMLGFNPGAEVRYDVSRTVLSLLLAIAATAFAFFSVTANNLRRMVVGGTVMGAGICIMHYVGMSAVITQFALENDATYVVLAFLVAVTASTGALIAALQERTLQQRALAAIVLGFAIVGMHYTAMFGVRLVPGTAAAEVQVGIDAITLAFGVAGGTFFILFLSLIAALSDRRFEAMAAREARALADKAEAQAALLHAQRIESLGRLTGGVAHDFNNLLTVIIGALDTILRHPENAERRKRLGEAALAAARRGERLTAQLLAFARRQPLHAEACDLNELIRVGEPLIRRAAGEERSLVLRLCESPAVALIDPAQFEGTLLNLIVNAVDASAAGSKISLETSLCDVSASEFPNLAPGSYFCVRVTDTGHGMSPQVMNRIFEPFYTTKAAGKGTGLGLSQVYGFVRQSGGEVRVQSKEGEGTTFALYLPVVEQVTDQATEASPLTRLEQRKIVKPLRILLTEDDMSVAAVTEAMLQNLGHEVTHAQNAEAALRVLRSPKQFDLLLSDIVMPGGVNGLELAHQAVAIRPGLQVLLSSGYAGEAIDTAVAAGEWPFLKKPYLEDELAEHLQLFAQQRVANS